MNEVASILGKANRADIRTEPFPHIVVPDALPQGLFDELMESYPTTETVSANRISRNRIVKSNTLLKLGAREVADTPEITDTWRAFFDYHMSRAFFLDVVDFWQDFIAEAYPNIEADLGKPLGDLTTGIRHHGSRENPANRAEDIQLDCQFGVNSAVDSPSSVRGTHLDSRYKLYAGLLYFRDPEDDSTGGEFELWRYRDPNFRYHRGTAVDRRSVENMPVNRLTRIDSHHLERVGSVPYAANVLVMWLNAPYAVHGVSPRQSTAWTRRYVNFLGEVYIGRHKGFFEIRRRKRLWPRIFSPRP